MNTTPGKWQTCKMFCSSQKPVMGEFFMNSFSMWSMASRVCKENKGVAADLQSPSLCQEKDLNADCQGRTRMLPGHAQGEAEKLLRAEQPVARSQQGEEGMRVGKQS